MQKMLPAVIGTATVQLRGMQCIYLAIKQTKYMHITYFKHVQVALRTERLNTTHHLREILFVPFVQFSHGHKT